MSDAANTASAFAAVEHIIAGDWDHVLMRLQAAIRQRTLTTAYRNGLIARDSALKAIMCGCGHKIAEHGPDRCGQRWQYPDVLYDRLCGCPGPWTPARDDSRYGQWADSERQAQDELEKALRR